MRRALALAVAFAVGANGVAAAQPPRAGLPDDAAPVAGPTASGARLFVWDQGEYLCGSVVRRRDRGYGSSCGTPPETLRRPHFSSRERPSGLDYVWGVVFPEVASVEVVLTSGRRVQAQTTSGDRYQGRRAGRFRFFLVEARWPRTDYPLYVRLLGEDGALLAAVDAQSNEGGRPRHPSLVSQGRLGRTRWFLRAFTKPAHAPLPGDEERVVTERCLELTVRGRGNFPQAGGAACDQPDYPAAPLLDVQRTCGPVGVQAVGMVRQGVRVQAVLGDGRRVRPALVRLPPRFGAVRAFVVVLAPEVALRSLATIEDGRRHVEIGRVGPGVADCPNTSSGWIFGFDFGLPRFGPEPPALQLRDNGVLLCATLGLPDPDDHDCGRPPLDPESSWLLSRATAESTTVAGVVPPQVGSVEVVFAGAAPQLVPTTEAAAYAGRYRGLIRVFSVAIPGEHPPRALRLNGLDGRRLVSRPVYSPPEFVQAPRTVLRSPRGWKLAAGIVRGGAIPNRFACLQLTRGNPSPDVLSCDTFGPSSIGASVVCRPRQTLVYGQVDRGVRRVEVRTTRGTVETGTRSLRRHGISGRAFLVELPATAALRRVIVHGERARRLYKQLPPAGRQCGYDESVSFR